MKLQKHLAYKYKDKKHYKHVLNIPQSALRQLGWKPGERLEHAVENGRLVIRPIVQLTGRTGETEKVRANLRVEKLERKEVNKSGNSE